MTDVRRVWLVGGAALVVAFRAEGLISEYILAVMPVLLGAGIPLFAGPGPADSVGLQAAQTFASGVVQLTYRVAK